MGKKADVSTNDTTLDNNGDVNNNNGDVNNNDNDNNTSDNNSTNVGNEVDVEAFADLISEKDKELNELRTEINKLKKTNAEMLVRMNAQTQPQKDIGQTILDFCDVRKVGQPTK